MKGVAHISFSGGGFVVPSQTPYEREILVQHIEAAARRHGNIQLAVDRRDWTVSISARQGVRCVRCRKRSGTLTYRFAGSTLCTVCAHRVLQ